ncbi:MAG: T9SS type A sorting domain-containing protein [Bacteroidota bacterium]
MKHLFTRILIILGLIWGTMYAQDAGVTSTVGLNVSCDVYGVGVPLEITYENFSATTITSIPVGYSINGGTPVNEVIATPLAGNSTANYTFTTALTLPNPNAFYQLKVWTAVTGDANAANDTFEINFLSPGLNTLPYVETFENFTPQTNNSNPGILNNGWTRSTTGVFGWHVTTNTTPTISTGPTQNHTPLGSVYMFTEASSGALGNVYKLNSPCIDLAGSLAPRLSFWYHMYGSNMGTLQVYVISEGDTTQAWTLTGQQQSSNAEGWREGIADLSAFAGKVVQLEFRGVRGNGNNSDMAIDDIFLFDPAPIDPGVVSVNEPILPTCYGATETIEVTFQNLGSQPLDLSVNPVTITADVTGPLTNSYSTVVNTGVMNVLDVQTVTITTTADLSSVGSYTIKAYTTIASDPNAFNDTTTAITVNQPVTIGNLAENFETFAAGAPGALNNNWTRTNTTNSNGWHVRAGSTPTFNTGPSANNTATGIRYMYIEANSTLGGQQFELATPCIDVSANLAPKMKFFYHMFGAGIGTLDVIVRNGGGDVNVFSISGQQQLNSNAPYDSALVDLLPYKDDVFQVIFRATTTGATTGDIAIDDINIFEPPAYDVETAIIVSPETSCGLSATEPIVAAFVNAGTDTLFDVDVSFNPDGLGFVPNESLPGLFLPGDTIIYTFNATADFSATGFHTLTVTADQLAPPDANPANNTRSATIQNLGSFVNTLPYFEDFEGGPGGWTSGGTNNSWAWGTPNKTVIQGAASGVNAWTTGGLTGDYNANENSFLLGPCFDLSNVAVPIIEFDIWWNSEFSWDGTVLQSSTDGGVTWDRVGNFGDPNNWYTDNTLNGSPGGQNQGWTGRGNGTFGPGSGGWVHAENELAGLGGENAVLLRFAFGSDGFVEDDGIAFDNILIYEKPDFNATAGNLLSPAGGCGYGPATEITVEFVNNGVLSFDSLDVAYSVNGGTVVTESASFPPVAPGNTGSYTFTQTADMSNLSITYDVEFWVILAGDTLNFDDTTLTTLTPVSIPTVDMWPYTETFITGNNGWNSGGPVNSWALGEPNKNTIKGAASDTNAWVTGGLVNSFYLSNEESFVIGPCMDMSDLSNPVISLSIWWNSEFSWDGAVLQASTDGGDTWSRVGNLGDPFNWYNDGTINGSPGNQQQGWTGRGNGTFGPGSGGWLTAKRALDGLGGQPSVRLRIAFGADGFIEDDGFAFDDIFIWDRADDDMSATDMVDLPRTFCNDDSTQLQLLITNEGLVPQNNIPVTVIITGPGGNDTLTSIATGTIAPDGTQLVDLGFYGTSIGGQYDLKAYTTLMGDTTAFNDTLFDSFTVNEVTTAPSAVGDSICSATGAEFVLLATPPSLNTKLQWFDAPTGGNVVAEGDTFITPILTTSQTYYVEASSSEDFRVGPISNSIGTGTWDTNFGANGLNFDVEEELVLESVRVFPENGSSGNITVQLLQNGVPITNRSFPFAGTVFDTVLNVNFEIQAGTGYQLRATGTVLGPGNGLYRNFNGATFPYAIPGIISINGNVNGFTTAYYYFYDWRVRTLGCPSPRTAVTAEILGPPVVDLGLDGVYCGDYSLDITDPTAVSYTWTRNGLPFSTGPVQNFDSSGLYSVLVTNTVGCTETDSLVLVINQAPEAEAGTDTTSCDPVTLSANTVNGATYFWFSTFPDNQDSVQTSYVANGSGTYILTVDALGCTATDTVVVDILPEPQVNLGNDIEICRDVDLNAGNGASFLWSTGDTTQMINVTPPTMGTDTYFVEVTSPDGCVGTDTIDVSQGIAPVISLPDSVAECDNATLDAGNPGSTYLWSTGSTNRNITVDSTGLYSINVTNGNNGCDANKSVFVEILESPTAAATYAIPNGGFTVQFSNLSTPIDPNTTFLWTFNDGTGNTSTLESPIYTFPFAGVYSVTLEVTNDCGTDQIDLIIGGVAIDAYDLKDIISVFPNPTKGELHLEGENLRLGELDITITDMRGREIYTYHDERVIGQLSQTVDLSEQPKGVYVVKISDGQQQYVKRVVRD